MYYDVNSLKHLSSAGDGDCVGGGREEWMKGVGGCRGKGTHMGYYMT